MITLITGGSASGKSAWAEAQAHRLAQAGTKLIYLATMRPFGAEGAARIERHRRQRAGKGFELVEVPDAAAIARVAPGLAGATALLDDLGNLLANEMFDEDGGERDTGRAIESVMSAMAALGGACANLVVVADEVGAEEAGQDGPTARFVRASGACCCKLAGHADTVVEVTCGVGHAVKGGSR